MIIPDRAEENIENIENENGDEDAGYPQSPDSDVPESAFSNPNRVSRSLSNYRISEGIQTNKMIFMENRAPSG